MFRYQAKSKILELPLSNFLELDRQSRGKTISVKTGYICPVCGSGSGANGTGITTRYGKYFKCWRGCFDKADVFDLIGMKYGLTNFNDKLRKACELSGINYDSLEADPLDMRNTITSYTPHHISQAVNREVSSQNQTDYMAFYKECAKNLDKCDYFERRGISKTTQHTHLLGFCSDWQNPASLKKGFQPPKTPRVIIPKTRYDYFARDVRPDDELTDYDKHFTKMHVGSVAIFGWKSLTKATEPIFVTESEIDSLSIIEIGHISVGLGGVANLGLLLNMVKENKPTQELLIALDSDTAGEQAATTLDKELNDIGVNHRVVNINGRWKDPNEHLVADRIGFIQAVQSALVK